MNNTICARDISGHRAGAVFTSFKSPYVYIPIKKNASGWGKSYFCDVLGWQMFFDDSVRLVDDNNWKHLSSLKLHKKLVILRDPVERWTSGIIQFIFDNYKGFKIQNIFDTNFINFLFHRVLFDEHSVPQINYLHNFEIDTCVFFYQNSNLEVNIEDYLSKTIPNEFIPIPKNLYKNDLFSDKTHIDIELHKKLSTCLLDEYYRSKIERFYKLDYDLINSVKFYEKV